VSSPIHISGSKYNSENQLYSNYPQLIELYGNINKFSGSSTEPEQ
jgi:hypothetical protein